MNIIDLLKSNTANVSYQDPSFVHMFRTMIPVYKKAGKITKKEIRPVATHKHEGDFFGLLQHLGIAKELHVVHLLINNLNSPGDYLGETNSIYVINEEVVNDLYNMSATEEIFI